MSEHDLKISPCLRVKIILLLIFISCSGFKGSESENRSLESQKISDKAIYLGAGCALKTVSFFARLSWGIYSVSPWKETVGNECLLLSELCDSVAKRALTHAFKPLKLLPSDLSWQLNKQHLSGIPAESSQDQELLVFLEKRWLAKSTGFFASMLRWVYPCFGIQVQTHPETSNCYSRNPSAHLFPSYQNRVESWKEKLPHPASFPLILTRPFDLRDFLPSHVEVAATEKITTTVERLKSNDAHIVVDLTEVIPLKAQDWLKAWESYKEAFSKACQEHRIHLDRLICIQRVQQDTVGGIRILPLVEKDVEQHHRYLLEWIGGFGIAATRVELDRWPVRSFQAASKTGSIPFLSKDEFVSYLNSYNLSLSSNHPQKRLLVKATLKLLQGLLGTTSESRWTEVLQSPTRSLVVQLSLMKIREQLEILKKENEATAFFTTASHVEQIQGHLSSLLEIFAPFNAGDFSKIYQSILTSIPPQLQPLTSCGIHASGMTSLAGIFKAMEKTLGKRPRVLYGQNTYFECVNAGKQAMNAISIEDAAEEDWRRVDLILAQFNPVWKRELQITQYNIEKIEEILHRALSYKCRKPLTLALDCTLDYINSSKVQNLLEEFKQEIIRGDLNIIGYRSGLKFDLLGMDNYCGAPCFMIHNEENKWAAFNSLLEEPALQSDRLSLNWFCLAYQNASEEMELYRKQIFDNTRELLNKLPPRLLQHSTPYRIVAVQKEADPAFIDIKISGSLHQLRGAGLVGGCLFVRSLEKGHPIFNRPSFGFYHSNFSMLFGEDCSTIRLTLGLDPAEVDHFAECFEMIDTLNGSPSKIKFKLLGLLEEPFE